MRKEAQKTKLRTPQNENEKWLQKEKQRTKGEKRKTAHEAI